MTLLIFLAIQTKNIQKMKKKLQTASSLLKLSNFSNESFSFLVAPLAYNKQ